MICEDALVVAIRELFLIAIESTGSSWSPSSCLQMFDKNLKARILRTRDILDLSQQRKSNYGLARR